MAKLGRYAACTCVLLLLCACVEGARVRDEEEEWDEFDFDMEEEEDEDDFGVGEEEEDEEMWDEDEEAFGESEGGFDDHEMDSDEFEEGEGPVPKSGSLDIKIAESAIRLKPFWEAYVIEILIALGMVLYLGNYLLGRTRNSSIAQGWLDANMELLKANFAVVGDTGEGEEVTDGQYVKESDYTYTLWCSGRQNCNGMLVQLQLQKRHDLLSMLVSLFKAQPDTVTVVFQLGEGDMDSVVLAFGQKKVMQRMYKEYEDLANYCPGVRSGVKQGLDPSLHFLSEVAESASAFLTQHTTAILNKHCSLLESLHISDQYTGLLQDSEDSDVVVVRKAQKRIQLTYRLNGGKEGVDPMLRFALQVLDQVRGIRLSKEGKEKTTKNRSKVAQNLDKLQHSQRQEAAQQRREERLKAEKERLLQENDPEKSRKWEDKQREREQRRAMKKLTPKVKQKTI